MHMPNMKAAAKTKAVQQLVRGMQKQRRKAAPKVRK
jgi:hypothetical protein